MSKEAKYTGLQGIFHGRGSQAASHAGRIGLRSFHRFSLFLVQ